MSFCIVDTNTRRKIRKDHKSKEDFKTRVACQAALTRYLRAKELDTGVNHGLVIMTQEEYRAQVRMTRVQNLISGKWIEIPEDTPAVCDPSTEAYWCK